MNRRAGWCLACVQVGVCGSTYAEAESKGPWTTPEGMLETSEGLPPSPTVPVPRPMKISLRTESLAADKLAGGFPC